MSSTMIRGSLVFLLLLVVVTLPSQAFQFDSAAYPKSIPELRDAIVKGLGFKSDEVKISGFDVRDALVGHSVAYEFDVMVDNMVIPLRLLEDTKRWEYVDLPIFKTEDTRMHKEETGLVRMGPKSDYGSPVLEPFQLAGPMEIWVQDADNMRLSLPNDVDAGVLKKVNLADGAVVTVKGARSVSLRHPIDLPLPLNRTSNNFASGLLTLAQYMRHASRFQGEQPLSLRIVGPTSLMAPSASSSASNRLKLRRLAPGHVELSTASLSSDDKALSTVNGGEMTVVSPRHFSAMWPLPAVNGSNSIMVSLEAILSSILGSKSYKKGSFRLLKAEASSRTFVKMDFAVLRKLKDEELGWLPEWRTKPESIRMEFELLAKIEGDKVVPETILRLDDNVAVDSVAQSVLTGNVSMSKLPIFNLPSSPFTL